VHLLYDVAAALGEDFAAKESSAAANQEQQS